MSFCVAINCMDGRVQLPVISYLQERLGVEHVDSVTDPGPVRLLAEATDEGACQSIRDRVALSVEKHGSRVIAVAAHHDCAGNPAPEQVQRRQLAQAVEHVAGLFPGNTVLGLWIDDEWNVSEVCRRETPA